jgi:signal recognition particle GTPase
MEGAGGISPQSGQETKMEIENKIANLEYKLVYTYAEIVESKVDYLTAEELLADVARELAEALAERISENNKIQAEKFYELSKTMGRTLSK